MVSERRLTDKVKEQMAADVADAEGNEVLWWGKVDDEKRVYHVEAAARGDESSVPALFPHMTKGDVIIHNHPSGFLTPSPADLNVATQLGNQGIGCFIVDNEVRRIYIVAEPIKAKEIQPLDREGVGAFLEPEGELSRFLTNYEAREPQIQLLKQIVDGFNEDKVVAAEAGTGVGKSFAYLLPAMLWADKNKERIVVSTGTINLQQQLMDKDIPLVQKLLGTNVKAVLVKGRRNYLCWKRFTEEVEDGSLFRDDKDEINLIKDWSGATKDGSLSDLSFKPRGELWNRVNSEADLCTGVRCRHYEKCFVMQARREASAAGILVVNHHLLFADLSLRVGGFGFDGFAVLPPFQRVIFDEAHNMEKSATSFFSQSFNRFSCNRYLNRLYRNGRKGANGLILKLEQITGTDEDYLALPGLIEEIQSKAVLLEETTMAMNPFRGSLWVHGPESQSVGFGILEPMLALQKAILDMVSAITRQLKRVPEDEEEGEIPLEIRSLMTRFDNMAAFMEVFRHYREHGEKIFWLNKGRLPDGKEFITYYVTPLDISPLMYEAVFEPFATVICTSATLAVDRNFSYWMNRSGASLVPEERLIQGIYDSPFNYRDQVLLTIPAEVPLPNDRDGWIQYSLPLIKEAILLAEGKTLVLFTSYEMLKHAYEYLKFDLETAGITLFAQGDDDRARLLDRFKTEISSVLLATDSFWEGVDVPGESLRQLIICRLPFRVPTEPVLMARVEALEARGGNAFMQISLPEAIMRFKQGFGRLMRSKSDSGVVMVLDGRIIKKNYGRYFLSSLPETQRAVKHSSELLIEMENFLYN
ncbi:MAG: helicase C-terminal domain-containing protein [Spirochaetales bacterium]|nr:helicase C-terminal domain-containing protein [Spirochaetales bacterium]